MTTHPFTPAILVMLLAALPQVAKAVTANTDKQSDKIESVLDKLENRYLDREAGPLTFDEQAKAPDNAQKPVEVLEIKSKNPIEAQTPNGKVLKDIQGKITEYDNQLDTLEADARKLKANLMEGSTTDNQIHVDVTLKDPKTASLRTLTAKIDGSTLFHQNDPSGMWIPAKSIAIYQGPMQPGSHRLEVTALVTRTNSSGLALAGWNQQQVVQSFLFDVPEGKVRKSVTVELTPGSDKTQKATAKINQELIEIAPVSVKIPQDKDSNLEKAGPTNVETLEEAK